MTKDRRLLDANDFMHRLDRAIYGDKQAQEDCMQAHAARLEREAALVAMLREVEWGDVDVDSFDVTIYFCPSCVGRQPGHKPGCRLQALLARGEEG